MPSGACIDDIYHLFTIKEERTIINFYHNWHKNDVFLFKFVPLNLSYYEGHLV